MSYFKAEMYQIRFRPGSAPDPARGAYDAPPDPLVGWGGGTPPNSPPLDAFGVSVSAPLVLFSDELDWTPALVKSYIRPCFL